MSTPISARGITQLLTDYGLTFKGYLNWAMHNRNHMGKWGPVYGVMWHHTGNNGTDQRSLLYNGYSNLPGPLCQFGISQDGTIHLIGWGRCNHAGLGDPDVLNAVISEKYDRYPPTDNQASVDGNTHFYGIEFWYSGSEQMTTKQYDSGSKLSAAICRAHAWTKKSVIGHGEWQPGKWDPGYKSGTMMDMYFVRQHIGHLISEGISNEPKSPPIAELPKTYKEVWRTDEMQPTEGKETSENPKWMAESLLRDAATEAFKARQLVEEVLEIVKEIRDGR